MDKTKDIHGGHRGRLLEKYLEYPDSVNEHELLELLLFYSIPRKDTNPVAHELIRTFGSLSGVLNASKESLKTVDGIGDKTASYLVVLGKAFNRMRSADKPKKEYQAFNDYEKEVVEYFAEADTEQSVLDMFNKKHNNIGKVVFSNGNDSDVKLDMQKILNAFSKYNPSFVILSHNHPSGYVKPSTADDIATKKLGLLCNLHGVRLLDHIIVSGNKTYSYFMENKIRSDYTDKEINALLESVCNKEQL